MATGFPWRSEPDAGQGGAINKGFAGVDATSGLSEQRRHAVAEGRCLSTLEQQPDVDFVTDIIFIDYAGAEIGRAVFPAHDTGALKFAGYVPQETMFWRRRARDAVGPIDRQFHYALDWDFMLRAEAAGNGAVTAVPCLLPRP
jgi:hypothetical protein